MTQNTNEAEIRELVENWANAVRAKEMKGVLARHADDIVMFDVPMPLQSRGIDEYKRTWDLFFDNNRGKENGQWLIAHEHHSYPIEIESESRQERHDERTSNHIDARR